MVQLAPDSSPDVLDWSSVTRLHPTSPDSDHSECGGELMRWSLVFLFSVSLAAQVPGAPGRTTGAKHTYSLNSLRD